MSEVNYVVSGIVDVDFRESVLSSVLKSVFVCVKVQNSYYGVSIITFCISRTIPDVGCLVLCVTVSMCVCTLLLGNKASHVSFHRMSHKVVRVGRPTTEIIHVIVM